MGLPGSYYGAGFFIRKGAFTNDELRDPVIVSAAGEGSGPGGGPGTTTLLYLVPERKFGVAVISNDGSYSPKSIVKKAIELYLGMTPQLNSQVKSAPATWSVYPGEYRDAGCFGTMVVSLEGEKLSVTFKDHHDFKSELTQISGDTFLFVPPTDVLPLPQGVPGIAGTFFKAKGRSEFRYFANRFSVGEKQ
jgi:hypothetical protein